MVTLKLAESNTFPATDNLFQTAFWGKIKTAAGQRAMFFWAEWKETETSVAKTFPLMALLRKAEGFGTYAYVPRMQTDFIAEGLRGIFLEQTAASLSSFCGTDCFMIRFDAAWKLTGDAAAESSRTELRELKMNFGTQTHALRKSATEHLCPDTVIINLALSPEKLLSRMRQTTRNGIRRAYKAGVEFNIYSAQSSLTNTALEKWHAIYVQTAQRKHFVYEQLPYFVRLFDGTGKSSAAEKTDSTGIPIAASVPDPKFYLFTAEKDGEILSGLILAVCGRRAYYMYAASSLEGRECMPNFGLQWEVMRFSRSMGCTEYDLMGIPPNGNSEHPMAGLYIFKTGFGGNKVKFGGAWDYPLNEEKYSPFRRAESIASFT